MRNVRFFAGFLFAACGVAVGAPSGEASGIKIDGVSGAWRLTAPGVYSLESSNGEKLELHVGEEGRRVDSAMLHSEIESARSELGALTGDERTRQELVLEGLNDMAKYADAAGSDQAGVTRDPVKLASSQIGVTSNYLSGHEYSFHDEVSAEVCQIDVTLTSDLATDAFPGEDIGYAAGGASWSTPPFGPPAMYRLTIGGYAKATNSNRTVSRALGGTSVSPGSSGTISTGVAQTYGVDFDCTLTTMMQAVGPLGCPAPSYLSLSRTKSCFDLWGVQ